MAPLDVYTSKHIPDRGPVLIATEATMLAIAVVVTAIRTRLRRKTLRSLRMEDWCCIGATVGTPPNSILLFFMVVMHSIGTRYGTGKHSWDLKFGGEDGSLGLKFGYVGRIFYSLATGLTRQSVLCLLLRIFPYKTFRRTVIFMIFVNIAASTISCSIVALQCIPPTYLFTPSNVVGGPHPGCLNPRNVSLSIPAINVALDVIVAVLPIRMIWKATTLPGKSKIMVVLMLGLGVIACIASCMRLISIQKAMGKKDMTWYLVDISIWANAEVMIGIVCVSAPALKTVCKSLFPISPASLYRKSITGPSQSGRGSFALSSLKRPEKTKVRLRMRDDGSVEQFRPNDVNRTITEIEGNGYGESLDGAVDTGGEDRRDFTDSSHGILRRMEVAVTISDRV